MNFFRKLFGKKESTPSEMEIEDSTHNEVESAIAPKVKTALLSTVNPSVIHDGMTVIYQSEIPASCSIGNLIFEKKYAEAIEMGLRMLNDTPDDPGVHINLMEAYFKSRETNPEYLDKSTYHAKRAILCGHHTGLAEDRLAKNLNKCKFFHQSLQLYNLILDNQNFHFSSHGMGNGVDFNKRREAVLKKLDKAADTEADKLFSSEEIAQIIQGVRDNDAAEEAQRKASEERIAMLKKQAEDELSELRRTLKNS